MPALNTPKYGIETLYLFPYYQTREAFEQATGQICPPWNPYRPPKSWFDPKAKDSIKRSIVYDHVIATSLSGVPLITPDGYPMLDSLVLNRDEAATLNIPPKGYGISNVPGADQPEVPVPLRPLETDEELFFDFGGIVAVRNVKLFPKAEVGGFTEQDRQVLRAIASKLSV